MSSVIKGVKKVFKKVFKAVKKIAPVVLGIGALVFTGGVALGLPGVLGGGWGAAASAVTAKLGATGVLGSALTGAIYQAGTGALIGGAISELSGGNFADGARRGAAAGAVTGGLMGTFSGLKATQPPGSTVKTYPGPERMPPGVGENIPATGTDPAAGASPGDVAVNQPPVAPQSGGVTGLMRNVGNWVERNQTLVGGAVQGIGQGLIASGEVDAEKELLQRKHDLVSSNYAGADPGASYRGAAPGTSGQTPTERFDPRTYGSFEFQYNPKSRRIERVAVQTPT